MTNKARLTRNLSHDSSCPSCGHDVEDTLHVLRDCARAQTVWSVLVENSVQQRFFSLDLADWIDSNISGQLKGNKTVTNWQLTFREDAKKVATCIPSSADHGKSSSAYLSSEAGDLNESEIHALWLHLPHLSRRYPHGEASSVNMI